MNCRNILGKIGEDTPQSEFIDVINLNNVRHNFPIFDIIAKKDGEIYAFSAKARNRYGANGKINSCYHMLYGKNIQRKYKKALDEFTKMGHDINKIHYCFLVCPLEKNKPCIYYWGEFTEINSLCNTKNILDNEISYFGIPMCDKYLTKYKIFGRYDWDYINEKYISSVSI